MSEDILDYTDLIARYETGLIENLRSFGFQTEYLDLWVPDANLSRSLLNLFDTAAEVGRRSLAVRILADAVAELKRAVLGCQRNNGLRQRIFISTNNGGVTLRSAWLTHNPAGMTLRETVLPPNALNRLPAPFGAYKFPEATSLSTCFSSDRSATRRFRRTFSRSRSFICLAWLNLQPTVFLAPAIIALLRYAGIPASYRRRFALRHRYFNLAKQRHNLLSTKPLLRYAQTPFQAILSQRLVQKIRQASASRRSCGKAVKRQYSPKFGSHLRNLDLVARADNFLPWYC